MEREQVNQQADDAEVEACVCNLLEDDPGRFLPDLFTVGHLDVPYMFPTTYVPNHHGVTIIVLPATALTPINLQPVRKVEFMVK
jgi:hypothetical protein